MSETETPIFFFYNFADKIRGRDEEDDTVNEMLIMMRSGDNGGFRGESRLMNGGDNDGELRLDDGGLIALKSFNRLAWTDQTTVCLAIFLRFNNYKHRRNQRRFANFNLYRSNLRPPAVVLRFGHHLHRNRLSTASSVHQTSEVGLRNRGESHRISQFLVEIGICIISYELFKEQSTPYEKAVYEAVTYLISEDRDEDLAFEMHTKLLNRFPKDLASLKRAQLLCFYMGQPDPFLGLVQQVLKRTSLNLYLLGQQKTSL
ncbi:hypothetical protein ISN44_As08g009990 [Arabidopsis suecica]|uniref:Uncharacterized protein n=1 Tax=Arabidopsis suecica TaxID=45249 RepID=A0A8T2B533_ARASU|nr:hypothetical protein ISN44_As08g009990 [Arabidopsis suecica]